MSRSQEQGIGLGPNARLAAAGLWAVVVVLSVALLANSMLRPISRDEHMYCSAGVLMAQGQAIYRDFSYPSQLPYHPLLLAVLYKVLGTTYYLLVGRTLSVVCDIGVIVLIAMIFRRAFGSRRLEGSLFASAAIVLHTFNPMVARAAGYAWNHDVVLFCVLLSYWLFMTAKVGLRSDTWRIALMGALLMFATCMRVTTALVTALFMVALFVRSPGSVAQRMRGLMPFSLAASVILAWPVWVFVQASQAVRINLFYIPRLYARWLHEIGMAFGKTRMTLAALTTPAYLVLFGLLGYLAVVTFRRRPDAESESHRNGLFAISVAVVFAIIAFIPPTMWEQYWAMPVPFLVIALAWPLADLCRTMDLAKTVRVVRWVVVICVAVTVYDNIAFLSRAPKAFSLAQWIPVQVHDSAVEMAQELPQQGPILTLGPLYALEGSRDIYPELANGVIVYRIAEMMSADQRAITHTAGPETIVPLLQKTRPAGAILGVESSPADLEDALRQAIPPDWDQKTFGDLQLYCKP